ncbi:DUF167 domain-containing protein [Sulfitobacter sp. LCG007]
MNSRLTGGEMKKGALSKLAVSGAELVVRVTPSARSSAITIVDGGVQVRVTAAPEGGKANAAVRAALSRALGIPASRLFLIRGETSRTKVFRIG